MSWRDIVIGTFWWKLKGGLSGWCMSQGGFKKDKELEYRFKGIVITLNLKSYNREMVPKFLACCLVAE